MNFIKVAASCPKTKVSDVKYNTEKILECIRNAHDNESKIIVFPELCLTSYTCADLFLQSTLLNATINSLNEICKFSKEFNDLLIIIGGPLKYKNALFNVAFSIFNGSILNIVPKSFIPNYSEFYEKRWFTEGLNIKNEYISLPFQQNIPFGVDSILTFNDIKIGIEICEDLWTPIPPSSYLTLAGANIICNLSASNELVSKSEYRRTLINNQSARTLSSYIYSSAGVYESTTDVVFSGHLLISENGSILNENNRFNRESENIYSIIDIDKLCNERLRNISFRQSAINSEHTFKEIPFTFNSLKISTFDRFVDKHPFVPSNEEVIKERSKEILNIQATGLAKRLIHTNSKKAVIGISGGLDSTLALLVVVKTFDMLGLDRSNIITITMPGFGTTDRTYTNAVTLCKELKCDFREVNITEACLVHFKDIGHDKNIHDVTYENVQARERTQILMDLANKEGGILVGTGDLSELALGWCTYNGDHMSMYSVNTSIPKTLVRYLVKYVANFEAEKIVSDTLLDILDTPVSPELLPKDEKGQITQKTEDIVGPYELHDFFLYYFVRQGATVDKIEFLANVAFKDIYSSDEINKWLNKFITRFFTQQFKRSALPDGPKVGTISLSPRGDFRMPSDASYNTWFN